MAATRLVACHCCGLVQTASAPAGMCCGRCETRLSSPAARVDNQRSAAIAAAALMLAIPALTLPFLRIERLGQSFENSLIGGVRVLFEERHLLVGFVVLLCSIILPLCKLSALLLLGLQPEWLQSRHRASTYRAVERLGRWGMLDVLLVAVMIAFIKLAGIIDFSAGSGLVMFVGFVVCSMLAGITFDTHLLWNRPEPRLAAMEAQPPSAIPPATAETVNRAVVSDTATSAIPEALPPRKRRWSWFWLLPALALLATIAVYAVTWSNRGARIEISFQNGHGLRPRDELRHLGVAAGQVESVLMDAESGGVSVTVRLLPSAAGLARQGARFWIVRPQFDFTGISGIDTVIGGKQLAVAPGPSDAPRELRFVGLETPPLPDAEFPGGLDVLLTAPAASGIRPGLPVQFRDLRVGGVNDVRLSLDGSAVEISLVIRPQYRHLIRENTVFWRSSGVTFEGSLTSIQVHVGSAETLLRGGIALANPDEPGPIAGEKRFPMGDRPPSGWAEWKPALPSPELALGVHRPPQERAVLSWENRGFFRTTSGEIPGWLLPVAGGYLAPRELARSSNGQPILRFAGVSLPLESAVRSDVGDHVIRIESPGEREVANTRAAAQPEDGFLVAGQEPPLVIAANRLVAAGGVWKVDPSVAIPDHWRGAAFVSVRDQAVIGLFCPGSDGAVIAPISPTQP